MIRLATVFSGIGAIEHALQRMQIKNEIIFACDNGDVSILTKKIDMNIDEIGNELKALSKIIKKIQFNDEVEDLYKNQLDGMLAEALNEYEIVLSKIDSFPKQDSKLIEKILKNVISMKGVKASRVKEYKKIGVAEVTSAIPLTGVQKQKVEQKLLQTTPYETMELEYKVDAAKIGGLMIRIGDRVVDGTVSSRLAALTSCLMKISLESEKEGVQAS